MFKRITILIVTIVFAFLLTGCGSKDVNNSTEENKDNMSTEQTTKSSYTFENLKSDLTGLDSGIQVNQKSATMVGAEEGYGYIMSSCSLEVYRFDKSSEQYKTAEKEQKLSMPSMNMSFNATVKNGYAYLVTDGTCDEALKYVEKLYK